MYRIELTPKAEEELVALGKSGDKASVKKVYRLFEELKLHPYEGTGNPEALVGNYTGYWSRHINRKDRLIYRVKEEVVTVVVVQVGQHYNDKYMSLSFRICCFGQRAKGCKSRQHYNFISRTNKYVLFVPEAQKYYFGDN